MHCHPFALAVIAVFATSCEASNAQRHVVVDPLQTHQTISGWEFTTRVWEMDKAHDAYSGAWLMRRDAIIDGIVNDAGLNRIRIEIRSGFENPVDYWSRFVAGEIGYQELKAHFYEKINDNDDPTVVNPDGFQWSCLDYYIDNLVLPMKEALEARGETLYINLDYVDFKNPPGSTVSHAKNSEEYAELIEAAFRHLRDKYAITPDAFEAVLEPDNTAEWRGERLANGIAKAEARLDRIGVHPDFIAPSTKDAGAAPKYFDAIAANPAALTRLDILAYHRYDGRKADRALPEIVSRAERYDLETAMLEYVPGRIDDLFADLTRTDVVAWQQYAVPLRPASGDAATLTDGFYPLAEVFRNVRRGAVRIGTDAKGRGIKAMAFRNPAGDVAIFILSGAAGAVSIEGAPPGDYAVGFAESGARRDVGAIRIDASGAAEIMVPARGLISLRMK